MKWKIIIPVVFLLIISVSLIFFTNKEDININYEDSFAKETYYSSKSLVEVSPNVFTLSTINSNVSNWTIDVSDLNNIGLRIDPWGDADDFMISYHDWGKPTGYSVTNDSITGDFRQGKLIKLENRNYDKEPNMNSTFEGLKITLVVPDKQVPSAVGGKVKFNFPVTSGFENYNYYLQPALTQEEIDAGDYRPDYVIDSIAVYHKNKGGYFLNENETKYGTGKAFHIYRPFVRDSLGNFNWGSWEIDNTTGTLIKVFDESVFQTGAEFYNVDGDLGYTSAGASRFKWGAGTSVAAGEGTPASPAGFTMTEDGTLKNITVYADPLFGGNFILGTWTESGGSPLATHGYANEITGADQNGAGEGWYVGNYSGGGDTLTDTNEYFIGLINSANNYIYYDTGSGTYHYSTGLSYNSSFFDVPSTTSGNARINSFYLSYDTSGGGSDTTKPTYSNINHNNSIAGGSTNFSISFNDDTSLNPLGQYIFSTNNTGSWVNDSAVNFTATPSNVYVIKTLNSTQGISVGYRWYVTDNATNLNYTSIQTITTTGADTCTYSSGNWDINCSDNCVISSPISVNGNISIIGSGVFSVQDNITMTSSNQFVYVGSGCEVRIESGGGFE